MHSQTRHQKTFYLALIVTLLVHGTLMLAQLKTDKVVAWKANEAIKLKLVRESLKQSIQENKRQIVQSEDSASAEKVKEAYLSDKFRSFEHQTKAHKVDVFKQAAKGNSLISSVQKNAQKKAAVKDLKLSDIGFVTMNVAAKEVHSAPVSQQIKGLKSGDPLNFGLSATNDYVEEVRPGDFTHLNTVEYKFYGFFHRIRQKLEQFWGKSIQEKAEALFRTGRRLPASENLTTSLQVTLNEKGDIIGVKILGASGIRELDDAAIESFNQAGPFPNPPKELLVNGKAVIEWGFVVKS